MVQLVHHHIRSDLLIIGRFLSGPGEKEKEHSIIGGVQMAIVFRPDGRTRGSFSEAAAAAAVHLSSDSSLEHALNCISSYATIDEA